MVTGAGLEPTLAESKSAVLPLDDPVMVLGVGIEPTSPGTQPGLLPLKYPSEMQHVFTL